MENVKLESCIICCIYASRGISAPWQRGPQQQRYRCQASQRDSPQMLRRILVEAEFTIEILCRYDMLIGTVYMKEAIDQHSGIDAKKNKKAHY